jgi:hypothetical protein
MSSLSQWCLSQWRVQLGVIENRLGSARDAVMCRIYFFDALTGDMSFFTGVSAKTKKTMSFPAASVAFHLISGLFWLIRR